MTQLSFNAVTKLYLLTSIHVDSLLQVTLTDRYQLPTSKTTEPHVFRCNAKLAMCI